MKKKKNQKKRYVLGIIEKLGEGNPLLEETVSVTRKLISKFHLKNLSTSGDTNKAVARNLAVVHNRAVIHDV